MLLTTFKVVPFSHKLLMLLILPSGGLSYLPAIDTKPIFTILHFSTFNSPTYFKKSKTFLTLAANVRQFRKVSNVELWPGKGVQYARSAGA